MLASMPAAPTFSIVTPTRNRPESLARAYESLRNQTCADWEWIVIDDASRVADYVSAYPRADSRVRAHRLATRGGKGAARNAGVAAARGAWIGFLDDDDELLPGHLAAMAAALRRDATPRIIRSRLAVRGASGRRRAERSWVDSADAWVYYLFAPGNIFPWIAPASVVRAASFSDDPYFQDAQFFLTLALDTPIERLPDVTGVYHVSGPSATAEAIDAPTARERLELEHAAIERLFAHPHPRLVDYRRRGLDRLAKAAYCIYYATATPGLSLRETSERCLRLAGDQWRTYYWLARLAAVRLRSRLA